MHPELGDIVVPTTPLRLHGLPKAPMIPSPAPSAPPVSRPTTPSDIQSGSSLLPVKAKRKASIM